MNATIVADTARRPALAWWKLLLILMPSLAVGYYAALYFTAVTFAVPALVLIFGGPVYSAIVLPIIALKWRKGRAADPSDSDEPAIRFDTNVQRWHFLLMGTLLLNLTIAIAALSQGNAAVDALGWVAIMFGPIAMIGAVPAIVLGLKWALGDAFVRSEGAALKHRIGAWRLILAHRILSWTVWVGYTAAAVSLAITFIAQNRSVI